MENKKAKEMKAKEASFENTSKKKKPVDNKTSDIKETSNETNDNIKEEYERIVSELVKNTEEKAALEENSQKDEEARDSYETAVNNLLKSEDKKELEQSAKDEEPSKQKDFVIDNNIDFSAENDAIEIPDVDKESKEASDSTKDEVKPENNKKPNIISQYKNGDKYLGYNERFLFLAAAIIIFAILSFVTLLNSLKLDTKENIVYKQSSNVDYTVGLKPNNYYATPTLGKGMQYVASLIDKVNINFNYRFDSNKKTSFKYYYYANADVKIYTSDNKVIYSKTNQLLPRKTITKNDVNGFAVNENLKVDYDQYNTVIKNFKSSYGISANSSLEVVLYIGVEDEKGNIIKSPEADAMKVIIPLTEQMINISMDYKEVNNSNNAEVYSKVVIGNKILFTFTIIFGIVSLASLVLLLLFIKKTSKKKSLYDVKLGRILRDYDKLIVTSKKGIVQNDNVIEVGSFEELLDARDNLEKPILFTEIHKGQKALFLVNGDNETYKYVLKQSDLEKEPAKKSIF